MAVPDSRGIRVLLVEDNPGDARLIREALRGPGGPAFSVVVAGRLSEALEHLGRGGFDVALVDLSLPDSRGLDTFLRVREKARAVPVLVLSGLEDSEVAGRAVREGAQDYVYKSQLMGDQLSRAILYALSRQQLMQQLEEHVKELHASEERYHAVTEAAQDAIVSIDEANEIVFANSAAERLFGYGLGELVGRRAADLLDEVARGKFEAAMEKVVRAHPGEVPQGVALLEGRRRGGGALDIELTFGVAGEPGQRRFTLIMRDVTERRIAEEVIRRSEERYLALVQGLDAIVWEADLGRTRFTFVSQRVETLLGYPATAVTGGDNFWELHVFPADYEQVLRSRAERGEPNADHFLEYRFRAADGRWVWLRDVVRVLKDSEGRPERLSGVMIDVSEVNAVQQYRENLIDVISHEFRTPVTVIQGYAQLLTEGREKIKPETEKAAKERIQMASAHLSYLLGSITELSRLRTGGQPAQLETVRARELIEGALAALASRGRNVGGNVRVKIGPDADELRADRRKMLIALVELLDNAAKFSRPSEPILVETRVSGENVVLTVEDQGPGIPEAVRDHLFKPFVQGDMSSVRPAGGAGLGLAVVAGLVRAQGGRVEVDSVVGKGSAFHIVLARGPPPSRSEAGGAAGSPRLDGSS